MPRIPPTLGLVGFDFGFKPAISLAAIQRPNALMNQQAPDDNNPPPDCGLPYMLNLALSGLSACPDCFYSPGPDPIDYSISGFSGINGFFSVVWNGFGWSVTGIGVVSISSFNVEPGKLPGLCNEDFFIEEVSFTISAEVVCSADVIGVSTSSITIGGLNISGFSGSGVLGGVIVNTGTCISGGSFAGSYTGTGAATVTT